VHRAHTRHAGVANLPRFFADGATIIAAQTCECPLNEGLRGGSVDQKEAEKLSVDEYYDRPYYFLAVFPSTFEAQCHFPNRRSNSHGHFRPASHILEQAWSVTRECSS